MRDPDSVRRLKRGARDNYQEDTMTPTGKRVLGAAGLALYLVTFGFAGGMAAERIRFDRERAAVLHRYDAAVRDWHQFLIGAERQATARSTDGSKEQAAN